MRRCRSCHELKPPERFRDSFARSCLACRSCVECGEPARPKRKTCSDDCFHRAVRKAGRKSRVPAPGRRKRCPSCLLVKPRTQRYWYVSLRDAQTGEVLRLDGTCKSCKRAVQRDKYRTDPERAARARRRAALQREEVRQRRAADPEYDERMRRYFRERSAASRRRRTQPATSRGVVYGGPALPAQPLVAHARRVLDSGGDVGVAPRTVLRWETGEDTLTFYSADVVLTKTEALWHDVWSPEEHPDVAALFEAEPEPLAA